MGKIVSNSSSLLFKDNQIVCLEHEQNCLYGEVIQIIPERQLCWFRPMCMIKSDNINLITETTKLIDLQLGSDLLWPIALFRPALDTEVISFLGMLGDTLDSSLPRKSNRKYLNSFIKSVWQANRDKF